MSEIAPQPPSVVAGEFLKSLSVPAREDLFSLAALRNLEPNAIVFTEGDPPLLVHVIVDGQVRLFVHSSTGRRLILRNAAAGDVLGLPAAFTGKNYDITAQTVYPSSIASIRRQAFMDFLLRFPVACQSAARELSKECFKSIARLRTMGLASSAQSRLARLLLEWSTAGQQTNRGRRFHVPMTHVEVGDCIGASRETVTRTMNDLQRDRVLELHGSLVTILDMPELENRSIRR
ncbi:MAG TPA: Crp/Fnr family transcriptional regulator [Terracidiphilus sp.]|nr:Crp/Fnr family transcriptional regulator [Terracidiphilus sp.]